MGTTRHLEDQNPLVLVAIQREEHRQRLCRAVSRIWHTPDFLIREDVRSALGHLIGQCLKGHKIRPDIMIIDLEGCRLDTKALFCTIRSVPGLLYAPIIALMDSASTDVRDATYDAGADLVVAWENLESRIGDIAGLAVDSWLNTDPDEAEDVPDLERANG